MTSACKVYKMIYLSNENKIRSQFINIKLFRKKDDKNVYLVVKMTFPTPMIIMTQTIPTITGRLSDEGNEMA